ncbi:MAG: proton-conducting transporter membrane subunit [Thermoprotei archaeon]
MIPYIGPALFGVSAIIGGFNRKLSYLALAVSSVIFAITQFIPGDYLSYFSLIAGAVWVFSGIYSLSYGEKYGKWLASLNALTVLGMSLILVSTNYIELVAGWEIMSIPSYAIVALNKQKRGPAFTFMAFSEFSTSLILAGSISAFVLSGKLTFDYVLLKSYVPLLLMSFGALIKMGMSPFMLSEWLPIAHGNAPANSSAVFSATMTLMGVFLIARMILLTDPSAALVYIGIVFLIIGSLSTLFASIYGYIAENMKMLGGFSTIENQAAILNAFGLYLIVNSPVLRAFVLTTVLIFAVSHSLSKTGLFLSIGSSGRELFGEPALPTDRWVRVGTLISTLSLSGLFPTIGGLGVWMLLESFFMGAYLGGFLGIIAIIAGSIIAISEGMVTGAMIKVLSFTSLFHAEKGRASKVEAGVIFGIGVCIMLLFMISPTLMPKTFIGGVPSTLVFNGFTIESKFSGSDFGLVSPDYVILLIAAFSIVTYAVFRKPKVRVAEQWNGGRPLTDEYTSFAYANNIRLMLKRILRTKASANGEPLSVSDVFWNAMVSFGRGYRKLAGIVTRKFMNGSIGWYIIYMIVAFMAVIVLSFFLY